MSSSGSEWQRQGPVPGQVGEPSSPAWGHGPAGPAGYPAGQVWSTGYGGPPAGAGMQDRTWALAAHLGSFLAAYVALGFLAPLVVLLVRDRGDEFVQRHARESLNFQLTTLLVAVVGGVVGVVLTVVTLGLAALVLVPLGLAWAVYYVVAVVVASRRAYEGRDYRYPVTLRFLG